MEGGNGNGLQSFPFVNDGSFLERFKQLQEQKEAAKSESSSPLSPPLNALTGFAVSSKKVSLLPAGPKTSFTQQKPSIPTGGKLAFSLKPKSRSVLNPLKLGEDDDDQDEEGEQLSSDPKPKTRRADGGSPKDFTDTIPTPPTDLEVKKVADKLAQFVAKNGRQFEDLTRRKNPGDTPFWFLFDVDCADYKYYNYRVGLEEKSLAAESRVDAVTSSSQSQQVKGGSQQGSKYHTPASALYGDEDAHEGGGFGEKQDSAAPIDSLSMMEYYVQKAAREDMNRPSKRSRDEMPPPASFQASSPSSAKKGHHMGDYIPPEELEKFLSKCTDSTGQMLSRETADRAKIQPDNMGHRLLSKMGWKEGEGLGSGKGGRSDPVEAGSVKTNNLGLGAHQPGEVSPDDDIYEQYKKRMMLGYRYRPNPLNNPRKAYY